MHDIKTDIKNNIYSNMYILTGTENFLIDFYTKEVLKANSEEDTADFNVMKISKELPSVEEIDAFANSYPFMSEKKVMVIQSTGIFKKVSEEQKEFWTGLVSNTPDYLIVVFAETEIDKRNAIYKAISQRYPVCEFNYREIGELASWLKKIFSSGGKKISNQDAAYMAEIAGPSMFSLKSEAEKIISYCADTDTITTEIINSLVTRSIENKVFDMVDDMVNGKPSVGMIKLNDLKALNEEPIKIISIIFKKLSGLHKLIILKNRPMREISALTGLYESRIRSNMSQANKLGAVRIANVMIKCKDMDSAIKNGLTDKWLAVELILSEIICK